MPFAFFTIPIRDDGSAAAELNAFLRSHRVLAIDRRWVEQGADSYWSFCVDYWERAVGPAGEARGSARNRVDYRERLSPEDFALFARLRDWRKQVAQTEGVPVYTVFTNEHLAQMVQSKARTGADLERVAGVGDGRVEKYGSRVLELLSSLWGATDAANG